MHIWVDADACPKAIKSILFKAANRRQIPTTLVANQYIATPPSKFIKSIQVAQGFDVADNTIVEQVTPGDLVITSDVPLAADVVAKYAENGIDMFDLSPHRLRVVVHLHITDDDVERFTEVSRRLFG